MIEALVAVAVASLVIRFFPFRKAVAFGAIPLGKTPPANSEGMTADLQWAIDAVASHVPWRSVCFQQGLAMQYLLRRRGIDAQLHYGMRQVRETGPKAHVWVSVDDVAVMGGEEAPKYGELARFPRDR